MSMQYDPILYDSDSRQFLEDEVRFYLDVVKKIHANSILELGVGTGRIFSKLLPKVGYAIGIDVSDEMISVCKSRCAGSDNYDLYNQDFENFKLNTQFDLIYIPFNTFQHLLTEESQDRCLSSVYEHLEKNGSFVLDVMNSDGLEFDFVNWKKDYSSQQSDGKIIERYQKTIDVGVDTSVIHKIFKYYVIAGNEIEEVHEYDALMKITQNNKLQEIIINHGFTIEEVWSDYFFGHDSKSKKKIYLLKK